MENTTKISFSAVTHIGATCTVNDNRIFANGKFIHPSMADYAQISLEVNDSKCFFALSEGMEDDESGISLTNDLKKFHAKAMSSSKGMHVKLDELVQCIEQSNNLLYSISLGENGLRERNPSFAGILVDDGNIAAVNLGNCRIYKLEGDTFKLLVNDYKRAERLLKMGIISSEQAEMLSARQKASLDEGRSTVKKSDINALKSGITYLICSSGLTDAVDEDTIYDILASTPNPDEAASKLVVEAVENEAGNNVTALVIKVEDADEDQVQFPVQKTSQYYRPSPPRGAARLAEAGQARRTRPVDAARIVSVIVLVLLATVVVFGGIKLWTMLRNPEAQDASSDYENTSADSGDSTDTSTSPGAIDEPGDSWSGEDSTAVDNTAVGGEDGSAVPGENGSGTIGPEGMYYTVKPGDMLMLIAKRFYGDESKYKLIMDANKITDPNKIIVGQKLFLPPDE